MELDEKAQALCTINTQKGLYRYNWLPSGVASTIAIWQQMMEQVLQGVVKTQCLLDDIIIAGADEDEHFKILEEVLTRLSRRNMTINMEKCAFFKDSLEFCMHRIDAAELHKTPSKITAVVEAPNPQDISQLRAFLGLVNYYNRFLPNLASAAQVVAEKDCERAFQEDDRIGAQVDTFQPRSAIAGVMCDAKPIWIGSSAFTCVATGRRKTSCICITDPFQKGKKLFTDRKSGIGTGMRDQTIPTIHFWKPFHTDDRPPALSVHSQPRKGITSTLYSDRATAYLCSRAAVTTRVPLSTKMLMHFHVS